MRLKLMLICCLAIALSGCHSLLNSWLGSISTESGNPEKPFLSARGFEVIDCDGDFLSKTGGALSYSLWFTFSIG